MQLNASHTFERMWKPSSRPGRETMLLNLFKPRHEEIDDDVLNAANQALHERLEELLNREKLRKMRFATLNSAQACLR
jgi:hypothetical protein